MTASRFLAVAFGILLTYVSAAMSAQDAAEPSFTLEQVGPNVWAAISMMAPRSSCERPQSDFRTGESAIVRSSLIIRTVSSLWKIARTPK
jgi:hypothetical protein